MTLDEWVVLTIFAFSYVLIFSEKVHRATAALLGALLVVGYLMTQNELSEGEALAVVEFDLILLLFGMMVVVGVLAETGFFSFVAVAASQRSKGNAWVLLCFLALATGFLSMVVDNLTTIILMVPVTMEIATTLEIDPVPLLLSEAMISNIGGVGTMVGDPPNVVIASYTELGFNDFIIHLMPPVLLTMLISLIILRVVYHKWIHSVSSSVSKIMEKDPYEEITDPAAMKRTLVILGLTVLLFIGHDFLGISPAMVALIGATATLLVNLADPERIMHQVEWSALLFFAGLFVLIGCVDKVGLLKEVAAWIEGHAGNDALLATLLILWISAVLTAFVDNIPMTMAMAPVILHMGDMGFEANPLWWALALGVGFGGNATPIGSSAGIIAVGLSERSGFPISLKDWMKVGIPLTLVGLLISTLFFVLFFNFFK